MSAAIVSSRPIQRSAPTILLPTRMLALAPQFWQLPLHRSKSRSANVGWPEMSRDCFNSRPTVGCKLRDTAKPSKSFVCQLAFPRKSQKGEAISGTRHVPRPRSASPHEGRINCRLGVTFENIAHPIGSPKHVCTIPRKTSRNETIKELRTKPFSLRHSDRRTAGLLPLDGIQRTVI